jgi:hypothetical protein
MTKKDYRNMYNAVGVPKHFQVEKTILFTIPRRYYAEFLRTNFQKISVFWATFLPSLCENSDLKTFMNFQVCKTDENLGRQWEQDLLPTLPAQLLALFMLPEIPRKRQDISKMKS